MDQLKEYVLTMIFLSSNTNNFIQVRVVRDKETGKSKGYAFIVYERESGTRAAYKEANGLKIKGRSILTDVERSRTSKSWVPRRLGGGLGGRGYTQKRKPVYKDAPKGRFENSMSSRGRGGSRFGSRGGFDGGRRGGRGGSSARGGGYERSSGPSARSGYSSYESRGPSRYTSRSERPSAASETRSERPERSEKYEYNSRSRREDRDFSDRDRDRERDSRITSEREKEREKYRERKLEQNKDRLRY